MPTFTYKAKDASGKTIREQVVAKDPSDVVFNLRQKGMVVISVEEIKSRVFLFSANAKRLKLTQLAQFSRQLSTMVNAGIPLVKDLKVLANQSENKQLKEIANNLCAYIEGGTSLSEALSRFPATFSPLYINMVRAGETSGSLGEILERLAVFLEKTDSVVRRAKSAMIYPAAIILVGMSISAFLILVVIPRFKEIFSLLGAKLPLPTRILINFSDFSRKYFIFSLVGIAFAWWLAARYINTPKGRAQFDSFKFKIPLLGQIFKKFSLARFSRTLATLLKSGVPILNSLDIVTKTVGNKVLENSVTEIKRQVSQGQRLAAQMAKEKVFPQMVTEMIGVGEESGQLEQMLNKVAEAYEEEVDMAIDGMLSLFEPFVIIFLGLMVGSIVLAMFLPILKITQVIGGSGG